MGDSFVEGIGVPDDSTWTRLLGNKILQSRSNIITLNGGCASSDVFYEYYKLKYVYDSILDPDLVILAINCSDLYDVIHRGGLTRFDIPGPRIQFDKVWWEKIYAISFIARFVVHDVLDYSHAFVRSAQQLKEDNSALEAIIHLVTTEFRKLAADLDFKLTVVLLAIHLELEEKDFILNPLYDALIQSGEIRVINMYEETLEHGEPDFNKYYWPVDRHCNSFGHQFVADIVYDHIKDTLFTTEAE